MLVTLPGIVTLVRPVQNQNALPPILVMLSGIVMPVRSVQKLNPASPMLVTPSCMVTRAGLLQTANARPPQVGDAAGDRNVGQATVIKHGSSTFVMGS